MNATKPLLNDANPRIGTGKKGNCLIGPCHPFALVRLGPDVTFPQPTSGYRPGRPIIGFSHTHLSGTGGCTRYGNLRLMPFLGPPRRLPAAPFVTFPATDRRWSVPLEEHAEIGLYRCRFRFGVDVTLVATPRTGSHHYRFTGAGPRHVLVDLAAVLQGGAAPSGQMPYCEDWEMESCSLDGTVEVLGWHELAGRSDFRGGWGHVDPYTVFFFVRSREPFERAELFTAKGPVDHSVAEGSGLRVLLTYPETRRDICLDVGVSFFSLAGARTAVDTENSGFTAEVLHAKTRAAWAPWLGLVEVEGGTPLQRSLLATLASSPLHHADGPGRRRPPSRSEPIYRHRLPVGQHS
ncbi:MAG: hypothetical protein WDO13_07915 [Verrucomicrobiota bacterium]